ncbi:xanthine dehydrogenase family protein molybdopterin-binding subunit [Roseovarius nanhaiticus]|uniref:xanthine dehydrogenase family protein molybdopterin-binding subunit n=1 Tax=Roseovarius nanhaiticus TaxID=573024 RepID=UPI0024909904|nr:xanthine dehydrogenase family protein molybdopterin-binding subunit [Roseovarius nanhaiticus]
MTTDLRAPTPQALLRGAGQYTADIALPGALWAVFLRSDEASGRIASLDIEEAKAMPGIHAVHTGADVAHLGGLPVNEVIPVAATPRFAVLAEGRVEAVGQPVAGILAEKRSAGLDAADEICLELDVDDVGVHAPIAEKTWTHGDAANIMARAAHVVRAEVIHPRTAPLSLETRQIAVRPEADGGLTIWHSGQTPHRTRQHLAQMLGIDAGLLRVITPDVGGAFGMKASLYPEEVYCVWAAHQLQRPVRWSATRSEDFLSATHGRGIHMQGALAFDADGRAQALEAHVQAPLGHWLPNSALIPGWNAARILPGGYRVEALKILTETTPESRAATGIYRGAGRPEAAALIERLMDKAARKLDLDPFEIRLRNLREPEEMPVLTGTGQTLDSGDYAGVLRLLRDVSGYDARLAEVAHRREQGQLVGLGLGFFLEPSGEGWESARVTWSKDGRVLIESGSSAQGQARVRSYAAIAAEALSLSSDQVDVRYGDTATCPEGIGAVASRSTAIGGSAVHEACLALRRAREAGSALPLTEEVRFETKGQAWGYGAYLVQMSVDAETGAPRIEAAFCVDDAGHVVDVQGAADQIVGGFAQGVGAAMMEAVHYDSSGQLLTASLMDYAVPRADSVPPMTLADMHTPSPMNPLGAKGLGEAGTIGAPAAILNAAIDALAPLGVEDLQMPLTSQTLWTAIQAARDAADSARSVGDSR